MSDTSEHSLPYVDVTLSDGTSARFGKLSVTDRSALLRKYKAEQKAETAENVKNLPPDQAYVELREFTSLIWGARKWLEYVNSFDGQMEVLRTAAAKQNDADKVDAILAGLSLPESDLLKLVCDVVCLPYNAPAPAVPNMKQVGIINGQPVYAPVDGSTPPESSADPNPPTAGMRGYGT